MIQLEYDVQTAGVRVSFILPDGTCAMPMQPGKHLMGAVSKEGSWMAPQNPANIKTLITMLECLLDKP
jgi:hypothetical protein